MGIYINIGNVGFLSARNGEYVDKSELISVVNKTLSSERRFSCVSRCRRSWIEDVKRIPQRKKRKLYGFTELNVGEIRHIRLNNVSYDVLECPSCARLMR
jgi:hypothetical protein